MRLFDSHCHLDDKSFDRDRESVIQRSKQNDVHEWLTVGIDRETSLRALEIAHRHDGCYASVGVHPHTAAFCSEETIDDLKRLSKDTRIRAWGETGLDFNRMYSPRADQEKWFIRQIQAADESKLPLIFHERDSNGRFLEILKAYTRYERKGVVHCFSGKQTELTAYLNLGLYIGITGILTIKKRGSGLRKLVQYVPADRLLIETDAPYLTPAPQKNKTRRNEPAFVKSVLMKLADVRQEDPKTLAHITRENAHRLFAIASDDGNRRG
jgi:TatD DNase family protein